MTSNETSILINDFKSKNTNEVFSNKFVSNSNYNLTLKNNIIEPLCDIEDFFAQYFNNLNRLEIYERNKSFLESVIFVSIYDYFNHETNKIESRLFVVDSTFNLFEFFEEENLFHNHKIQFESIPKIFQYKECLYFTVQNDKTVVIEGNAEPMQTTPAITISLFVEFNDYLFFCSSNNFSQVFYTESTDLYNISQDLSIYDSFDINPVYGKILNLCHMHNRLYIFQEFAITEIDKNSSAFYEQKKILLTFKIFPNTIKSFSDEILFLSQNGLFSFNGNNIDKILELKTEQNMPLTESFNHNYYFQYFEDNKYFLCEYDVYSKILNKFYLGKFFNFYKTQSSNHFHLIIQKQEEGMVKLLTFSNSLNSFPKYIRFSKVTFGINRLKLLKSVKFFSSGDFELKIISDKGTFSYNVNSFDESISNIGLLGNYFEFEISSIKNFTIESILITVSTLENGYE
ncbi:MAG: hypothetical protein IKB06_04225 [Clostridia bacterium]|nr:hypothetical protein [Clostridia bacterium]